MTAKQPIRHILVAHDFEKDSDVALEYALGLAKPLGAKVTILHAYEIPSMGAPEVLILATDWTKQIGAVAREALDKIVARVGGGGVPVAAELREGTVWREVQELVKSAQVDLVVVGSHGRRGLPRALLGSVAEKIVRTAPCPVLVVRGAGHEG
jgi:nucleotide-binding universal stress UspA family protein